ncbi:hypothetical protein [Aureimonas ureilytica]|uniref:hypothetical protein n=1 Tax=Aureimonas ureilytica TaxID=401562 RepID=UPI00128ED15D|nr:hypothetical protein [Aureimonas ureilytica]
MDSRETDRLATGILRAAIPCGGDWLKLGDRARRGIIRMKSAQRLEGSGRPPSIGLCGLGLVDTALHISRGAAQVRFHANVRDRFLACPSLEISVRRASLRPCAPLAAASACGLQAKPRSSEPKAPEGW